MKEDSWWPDKFLEWSGGLAWICLILFGFYTWNNTIQENKIKTHKSACEQNKAIAPDIIKTHGLKYIAYQGCLYSGMARVTAWDSKRGTLTVLIDGNEMRIE